MESNSKKQDSVMKSNQKFNAKYGKAQFRKIWVWSEDRRWWQCGYNENAENLSAWVYADNASQAKHVAAAEWMASS